MVITKQKSIDEILKYIEKDSTVFLIGCAVCATTCKTGGENELKSLSEALQKKGKIVAGWDILNPACYIFEVKKLLRRKEKELAASQSIISLACGGGTQAIAEVLRKPVYPANVTLFQGEIIRLSPKEDRFEKKCLMCGECIVGITGAKINPGSHGILGAEAISPDILPVFGVRLVVEGRQWCAKF